MYVSQSPVSKLPSCLVFHLFQSFPVRSWILEGATARVSREICFKWLEQCKIDQAGGPTYVVVQLVCLEKPVVVRLLESKFCVSDKQSSFSNIALSALCKIFSNTVLLFRVRLDTITFPWSSSSRSNCALAFSSQATFSFLHQQVLDLQHGSFPNSRT